MEYKQFLDEVLERTGLSDKESEVVVQAFLETLGERLHHTERDLFGAQLPKSLRTVLTRRKETDRYQLEEFYNRVRARADIGYPDAVRCSLAIAAVLQRSVSKGELDQVLATLPAEYSELFGRKVPEPESPTTEKG